MITPEKNPGKVSSRRNFLVRKVLPIAGATVFGTLVTAVAEGTVRATETSPATQIHIEFDIQGDNYAWDINNADWGIYPPNDPNVAIGTVRVAINNVWNVSKSFQPLASLYPPDQYAIIIGGMAVHVPLDKYYLGTGTGRGDGYVDPYFEVGTGVKTPDNYTGRIVIRKGLPQGGIKGLMYSSLVILGSDTAGNYADYIFSDCINSSENGTYRIQIDKAGNIVGDTFVKISNSVVPGKPFQLYIPLDMKNH